jgi:hypothetical protein
VLAVRCGCPVSQACEAYCMSVRRVTNSSVTDGLPSELRAQFAEASFDEYTRLKEARQQCNTV